MPLLVSDPGDHKVTLFRLPEKGGLRQTSTPPCSTEAESIGSTGQLRHLRPARSEVRRHHGVQGSARPRTLWNGRSHRRASLVRLARRQSYCRIDLATAMRPLVEAPTPNQGARRGGRIQGARLGQRMEQRQRIGCTIPPIAHGKPEAAGKAPVPMRSTSTTRTRSGSPISPPMRSYVSIRWTEKFNVFASDRPDANVRQRTAGARRSMGL